MQLGLARTHNLRAVGALCRRSAYHSRGSGPFANCNQEGSGGFVQQGSGGLTRHPQHSLLHGCIEKTSKRKPAQAAMCDQSQFPGGRHFLRPTGAELRAVALGTSWRAGQRSPDLWGTGAAIPGLVALGECWLSLQGWILQLGEASPTEPPPPEELQISPKTRFITRVCDFSLFGKYLLPSLWTPLFGPL